MAGNLARGNDLNIGQGKGLKLVTLTGVIFLLLPLIILIVFSFNESKNMMQWQGFSLKWYASVFHDKGLWLAVKNSMIIAIISTVLTTVLGTMCAMLLGKFRFRGRALFQNLLYVPVILPEIIFGVALLAFFLLIDFPLGLLSIIVAHVTFSFPFVTLIILSKVLNLPASLEEASLDLGAGRWQTFVKVILPYISPGVVSGAMFAFTLSIDDFVVTFFTAGVGASTLPLKIYSLIKFGVTPAINAVSTILIIFTVGALIISDRLQKSERIPKNIKITLGGIVLTIIIALVVIPMFSGKGEKLNIYNYSEYLDEKLVEEFEKETGIDVSIDYFNDGEELLSRMKMGVTGYDIIVPTGYMVKIMKEQNLLARINYNNIPNYKYVTPLFKKLSYDTTGMYYIPYVFGFTGIVYNQKFIKDTVDSWTSLWNPAYKDKILMIDNMYESFWVAYKILGMKLNADTSKLAKALDLMIKQKPLLKKYESNATEAMMMNEEAWIAHTWNGLIARLNMYNPDFKLCMPKEGVVYWLDNMCIPASAPNKANAEKFLNFLYKPENSAINMRKIMYAMPNEEARKMLEPELQNNRILFPEMPSDNKIEILDDLGDFNKYMDRAWTTLKVSK